MQFYEYISLQKLNLKYVNSYNCNILFLRFIYWMVDKLQIRVKLICARIRYKNYYLEITVKCTFLLDLYLIANFLSDALDKWFLRSTVFNMMTRLSYSTKQCLWNSTSRILKKVKYYLNWRPIRRRLNFYLHPLILQDFDRYAAPERDAKSYLTNYWDVQIEKYSCYHFNNLYLMLN